MSRLALIMFFQGECSLQNAALLPASTKVENYFAWPTRLGMRKKKEEVNVSKFVCAAVVVCKISSNTPSCKHTDQPARLCRLFRYFAFY